MAEQQRRRLSGETANGAQPREGLGVSGVRGRREQQDDAGPGAKRRGGGGPGGIASGAVRFVDHQHVPTDVAQPRQQIRLLRQIERDHGDAGRQKRADARRCRAISCPQRGAVDHVGLEIAARAELLAPLIAQRERREDEHAVRGSTRGQFANEYARFDRLALADAVGQQQARRCAMHDGEHR